MTFELIAPPPRQREKLGEAFDWYEERVSGLGSDFLMNVDAALNAILRNPRRFPVVHNNLRRALIRRFPYQIFFVFEEKRIVVLAVFHASRNPRRWLERNS